MNAREWKKGDRVLVKATVEGLDDDGDVIFRTDGDLPNSWARPTHILPIDGAPRFDERRERIATAALQGLLSNGGRDFGGGTWTGLSAAQQAVAFADALIGALDAAPSAPIDQLDEERKIALEQRLEKLMRHLSESMHFAQWHHNIEYELWAYVVSDKDAVLDGVSLETAELRDLSGQLGGWFMWDEAEGDPVFVPMDEWTALYAKHGAPKKQDRFEPPAAAPGPDAPPPPASGGDGNCC